MFALFLLFCEVSLAQSAPKLPANGWITAHFDGATLRPQGELGVAIPFSRVTALSVEGFANSLDAGLNLGPTFEIGSLYLSPMASFQSSYTGEKGFGGQLLVAWEAPPLPLYLESRARSLYLLDESGLLLSDRTLLMVTLPWFAVGAEHDGEIRPVGGHNRWGPRFNFGIGKHLVLGVYAGFECDKEARETAKARMLQTSVALGPTWLSAQATATVRW
jgi:hypothetical protein